MLSWFLATVALASAEPAKQAAPKAETKGATKDQTKAEKGRDQGRNKARGHQACGHQSGDQGRQRRRLEGAPNSYDAIPLADRDRDPDPPGLDRRLQRYRQRRVRRAGDRGRQGVPEAQRRPRKPACSISPSARHSPPRRNRSRTRSAGAWLTTARAARGLACRASSCRRRPRSSAAHAGHPRAANILSRASASRSRAPRWRRY